MRVCVTASLLDIQDNDSMNNLDFINELFKWKIKNSPCMIGLIQGIQKVDIRGINSHSVNFIARFAYGQKKTWLLFAAIKNFVCSLLWWHYSESIIYKSYTASFRITIKAIQLKPALKLICLCDHIRMFPTVVISTLILYISYILAMFFISVYLVKIRLNPLYIRCFRRIMDMPLLDSHQKGE